MGNLTKPERKAIVRGLALALVEHMGVEEPPVWVESLLKDPPTVFEQKFPLIKILHKVLEAFFVWSPDQGYLLLYPSDLPLVERRFVLAKELLNGLMKGLSDQATGLSKLLLPDLKDTEGYFARVFLAPDPMIEAYRKQGRKYKGFAETFLLPDRVASQRWKDPIFERGFSGAGQSLPFSFS